MFSLSAQTTIKIRYVPQIVKNLFFCSNGSAF